MTINDGEKINPSWIEWDADPHSHYVAQDLNWTFVKDYPIKNIGGDNFIEEMKEWLDTEITGLLESVGLPLTATVKVVREAGEHRLAGWMELDLDIANGQPFTEEVHIAEIPCEDTPSRNSIGAGWHRIAAAIKHGKSTIPAFIGRKG